MADKSRIEWTDATWNPVTGCTPISMGCENCYAKRHAERFRGRFGYPADDPFRVTFHEDRLEHPLRWAKPRKIFVCSMGDLFHDDVELEWLYKIFGVIARCPQHRFMVLTKRPARMRIFFNTPIPVPGHYGYYIKREGVPLEVFNHLWLGVTAENQRTADERIPILLQIPAAVRFVSVEPMLGPVDISPWDKCDLCGRLRNSFDPDKILGVWGSSFCHEHYNPFNGCEGTYERHALDWVICGGESGPGARPMHPYWAQSLRDQCVNAQVPFFFKQWGEWESAEQPGTDVVLRRLESNQCVSKGGENSYMLHTRVGKKAAGRELDGREWNEWPEEVE
ncbi:MAG: phage Gp37/Gp68 family protein [Synergistota bacterium]|nr:phage Gp37/Gp68 family protein [Synergistota bacterium]